MEVSTVLAWLLMEIQEVIPTVDQGGTYGGVYGFGVDPYGKFSRSWHFGFIHIAAGHPCRRSGGI